MENLHLKNLKNQTPDLSQLYRKQYQKLLDIQKNIIEYANKTKMKNCELEKFRKIFLQYFTDKKYICTSEYEAFEDFAQIIFELNNADIGTDISNTYFYTNNKQYPLSFIFNFEFHQYNKYGRLDVEETELSLDISTTDGVIRNITTEI